MSIFQIEDDSLRQSVEELINAYPASLNVIERLIEYFDNKSSERDTKRRKVNSLAANEEIVRIVDISFQLPVRKKLDIIITSTRLLLYNSKNDTVEFEYNLSDISPLGGACVPSPDKAIKTFTYTLFVTSSEESIVFNTQDKVDVTVKKPNSDDQQLTTDKHETICKLLTEHTRVPITQPSKTYFKSTGVSSSTGKIEDRAHVVAYLRAKDGFLFFLPTGILFGFKKPTLFFPNASIASTVITNITNRTFDFSLTLKENSSVLGAAGFKPTKEGGNDIVQFSMIEQSEYEGIDAFVKKLGINDSSMSEERKAVKEEVKDKGKGKQAEQTQPEDDDEEENDDDFEPSEDDSDPLEYDTDAEEDADRELAGEEEHEFEDAMQDEEEDQAEEDDEEEGLLDEDSD